MEWQGHKNAGRVIAWLEHAADARYARDRRLDPFATSMRDFDDVTPNLQQIREGLDLTVSDPRQRVTDLKNAGLIDHTGNTLSELGIATLEAWERFGVASPAIEDEFARHLLLLLEAQSLGEAKYTKFFKYWSELRSFFDPVALIDNWDALYALNYLDFERDGYNPGHRYREDRTSVDDIDFDLDEFAGKIGASYKAMRGAERIESAISGKIPRGRHRATFCAALEAIIGGEDAISDVTKNFGVPKRPRQWVPFDESQIKLIHTILDSYKVHDLDAEPPSIEVGPVVEKQTNKDAKIVEGEKFEVSLPEDIDFSRVLVESPKPRKISVDIAAGKNDGGSKKVDHKKKAAENDLVGITGEKFAVKFERWRLREYPELAKKIVHVSLTDDSKGYDILSFETDGTERFVEVKSTLGPMVSRFYISSRELAVAKEKEDRYIIMRVCNLEDAPKCCEIRYPFDKTLELEASNFTATFK